MRNSCTSVFPNTPHGNSKNEIRRRNRRRLYTKGGVSVERSKAGIEKRRRNRRRLNTKGGVSVERSKAGMEKRRRNRRRLYTKGGVSVERSKAGMEKISSDDLNYSNRNTIIINIIC